MKQIKGQNRLTYLAGYLLAPHELLHVVGFRLVGKQCQYRWGNTYVTPIGPMTRRERLVGMLFPFTVFFALLIGFAISAGFAAEQIVFEGKTFWFIFWMILTYLAGFYACTAIGDLRRAYLLIFDKPWHSWTPFDFLFRPFMDWNDIRKKVDAGEFDDKQN